MTVCAEACIFVHIICIIIMYYIFNLVPVISWNDREVNVPEGGNRQVCFSSDIGTVQPYDVMVGARPKGASPATRGMYNLHNV